jgi:CRP-like cAMP-binding protein
MKEILNYLSKNFYKLTREAKHFVLDKCDEREVKKGDVLLEEGKVCRYVWFVKKGMLMASQRDPEDPGKEVINWFMRENEIATGVLSFFTEAPSAERIVVNEDGVVFQMSKKDLFAGIEEFPCIAILTLYIVIKYYCETRVFETFLRMKKPEYIYQYLLAVNHELLQRVREKPMAKFLGVSDPQYRRIKRGKTAKL